MLGINRLAIATAFVSIASRLVGSSFRVAETFNPEYRKLGITPSPEVAIKREGITLGLAWLFALMTSVLIMPAFTRLKFSKDTITFMTAVIGTAIAETVSRKVAYRNLKPHAPALGSIQPLQGPTPKPMPSVWIHPSRYSPKRLSV